MEKLHLEENHLPDKSISKLSSEEQWKGWKYLSYKRKDWREKQCRQSLLNIHFFSDCLKLWYDTEWRDLWIVLEVLALTSLLLSHKQNSGSPAFMSVCLTAAVSCPCHHHQMSLLYQLGPLHATFCTCCQGCSYTLEMVSIHAPVRPSSFQKDLVIRVLVWSQHSCLWPSSAYLSFSKNWINNCFVRSSISLLGDKYYW